MPICKTIQDPFLKQSLMLAVDGTEPAELRKIMHVSLDSITEQEERLPAVFESAGGFSPTIGILGAVLGLIQVMQHLDNINEVGRGIAVAFVATIYGVGIANLFLLPLAGKMHIRIRNGNRRREMMLEGVVLDSGRRQPADAGDQTGRISGRCKPLRQGTCRMNRRVSRSSVGQDRWLVSYADFITLLFGFFVVLYAFARADQKKQIEVSHVIDSAFHAGGVQRDSADASRTSDETLPPSGSASAVMGEDILTPTEVEGDLDRLRQDLSLALHSQIASHTISLEMGRDGLVISLREAGFFGSGSAAPKDDAVPTLRQIAAKLGATPYDLRIEGHTDNVPIHNSQFDSNWELSATRATRIARLFLEMKAIAPDRISAAGYAEYHPVASNSTAEGRAKNRRVDLVVMPRTKINFAEDTANRSSRTWRKVTDRQ